jgi:hypothetical protein
LIIRTKQVPPRFRDTEEITVTVTDTGGSAQADVDVVYYEEQLDRALPLKPAAATRTKTAKKTKKPKLQQKKTSSKTKK